MKRTQTILTMIALAAAIVGCKKESSTQTNIQGNYKGSVFITGTYGTVLQPDSVHISFVSTNYQSQTFLNTLNQNDTGSLDSGIYSVKRDSVYLTNLTVHPAISTDNTIPGYGIYFEGKLHIQIKADSLILTRNYRGAIYTYRLKKQ